MKDLCAAVVGTGHLGRHHARNLARVPGVRLVAVIDPDEGRGRAAAEVAGTTWVRDAKELQDHLDLVSIAAPTPLHFELARGFLERGIHCLIEKPMCATAAEARELAKIAESSGARVQVGHIERFNPVMEHLPKDLSPKFLDMRRFAPYPNRSVDTSVIFDLMIHDLDLSLLFARSEPVEVLASGGVLKGPELDFAHARIQFASGAVAHVAASRVAKAAERCTVIHEATRSVEIDFGKRSLTATDRDLNMGSASGSDEEPLFLELASFVDCVREGRAPACSHREGLAAVELADRVAAAIRNRG